MPDDLRPAFADIPGTQLFVDNLDGIHGSDWDMLVVFGTEYSVGARWHVLGFGIERAGNFALRKDPSFARHAYVSGEIETDSLRTLCQRSIVDVIAPPPRRAWRSLAPSKVGRFGPGPDGEQRRYMFDLVCVGEEAEPYAIVTFDGSGRLTWALPSETTEHRAWLLQVLKYLHGIDAERFPAQPDWRAGTAWSPPALRDAQQALDGAVGARAQAIEEADAHVAEAERTVDQQTREAANGPWRLLTAQGKDLEETVRETLESFGFTVFARDEEHHKRYGRRLEDLLVTDPDVPHWEALVEVKGYGPSKGASLKDLSQVLGAPSTYFAVEHGRPPASVWHVVNVYAGTDPSARGVTIPNETDLSPLTEAHGALIDTRALFRAWSDVVEGHDPASVRASLRSTVTRWTWPVEGA